jgi:hypothetical protein
VSEADDSAAAPRGRRTILASKAGGKGAVAEIIEAAFAAELLDPSPELWVVSPWISDVPVLDNTTDGYATLCADFARGRIPVSQVLAELIVRGTRVNVVTRPDEGGAIVRATTALVGERGVARLRHVTSADVHVKVILSKWMELRGSMNLTFSGTEVLDELESFTTDAHDIAVTRTELQSKYRGAV